MFRIARISTFIFLAAWLSGCATNTPTQPIPPTSMLSWQERTQALSALQNWQINGKIAVQTQQEAGSASLDWRQRQHQYTVSLMGPLGARGLKLSGKPGSVTLEMSDGKRISAASPEALLAQTWGFHLPVSYLNYWIRGLPVPNLPAQTAFDTSHRLTSLIQDGWRIQFQRYTSIGNMDLPDKLLINSAALRTKIIIYKWDISH